MSADTIVAISTALGEAAISVVRVSGPRARQIGVQVFGSAPGEWTARMARLAHVRDGTAAREWTACKNGNTKAIAEVAGRVRARLFDLKADVIDPPPLA